MYCSVWLLLIKHFTCHHKLRRSDKIFQARVDEYSTVTILVMHCYKNVKSSRITLCITKPFYCKKKKKKKKNHTQSGS